jgi:hypothetical protein
MTDNTKRQDAIFHRAHPQMSDPTHRAEIVQEVFDIARERGIPNSKLMEAYNRGDPQFRSATAQAEWYRAAKERIDDRKDHGGDLSAKQAARMLARRRGTA